MPQATTISRSSQEPVSTQLKQLRARADELKLRASDLEVRKNQLGQQRAALGGDVSPAAVDKQLADVQHELSATYIQLESTNQEIHDVESARDMARVGITVHPPPPMVDPNLAMDRMVGAGAFLLLLPLVLAFARRIWRRGGAPTVDLENSPRLQRMEQAIESIALEVERIGEAQRFTTKLLADRQPDAAARLSVMPRKEPGTITPH
ncbi:MAG: hypothetical protein ACJ79A_20645 [Gemmatimonadaceae bacterium]